MIHLYTRVSTGEQDAPNRTSMKEQERICRGLAMARGANAHDIAIWRDPGVSGSVPVAYRPDGGKMWASMVKGDMIIAAKLDRLFRNALDALVVAKELRKRGIDLVLYDMGGDSVLHGATSKAFFGMVAIFAEMERDRIEERMRDGKAAKRRNGGHTGGEAPYGYSIVGSGRMARLEPCADEHVLLDLAHELSVQMAVGAVTRELNSRGYRSRAGSPFRHVQVKRLIAQKQRMLDGDTRRVA